MKKTIALLLSVLLLSGALAGCGTSPAEETTANQTNDAATQTTAPAEAPPDATPAETPDAGSNGAAAEVYAPDGSVLFEKDGVKITTAGLDTDPTSYEAYPIIWVDIENSGSKDAYLGITNGSINGFMGDVLFLEFYEEDGEYYGSSYDFSITVPAGENIRRALTYYKQDIPGVDMDTLNELSFTFATAEDEYSWYNDFSEPVVIRTGEAAEAVDIASLGTTVIDNDTMKLVFGEQDYDDWFGPMVAVYVENRSDHYIGLQAGTAEGDGVYCDYIYYYTEIAPGKLAAGQMAFEGELAELKGFENLSVSFKLYEAATADELYDANASELDPLTVTYPPQIWGEYENGGLRLEIRPKYNELVTVETPENDAEGILFTVSETASLETGGYEGAGWLFSIGKVDEETLHEMLCYDMSGAYVFAKDDDGNYYVNYHPTDVRYERATTEEMTNDIAQWTELNEWADGMTSSFIDQNGLENASFSNTLVDMYVARAAWTEDVNATLSTTEYGPLEIAGVDGAPYAEHVMRGWFWEADPAETPDGEYVVLNFPDEDVRLDFFTAPGSYVRVVMGDYETLYESVLYDEELAPVDAMKGWYYAVAERAGVKAADTSLDGFLGSWYEKIAGRGEVAIAKTVAPGKVSIQVRWPESASVVDTWVMTATLTDEGRLAYENGEYESNEYDEDGQAWMIDGDWGLSGEFYLNDAGELCWYDGHAEGDGNSTFVRGN